MARQMAAAAPPEQRLATFRELAPRAVSAARSAGPIAMDYFGNGTLPLGEALSIFILEAVVHGLDLAAALDGNRSIDVPPLPAGALDFTAGLLAAVAAPVSFIEAATGRTPAATVLPIIR
jgi:hypothetical protein